MHEDIASCVAASVRFIAYCVIWSTVLFNLGRASVLLVTAGHYPRGFDAQRPSIAFHLSVSW